MNWGEGSLETNVVVGGAEDDDIDGGAGAGLDILIGSTGLGRINGDKGDDILGVGWTDDDRHVSALDVLINEWSGPTRDTSRTANITGRGGSLAGLGVFLNDLTVHDDSNYDEIESNDDRDLFFFNIEDSGVKDKVRDLKTSGTSAELRIDIDEWAHVLARVRGGPLISAVCVSPRLPSDRRSSVVGWAYDRE